MNRQAGPSIILSFLIVCFFAVVLFPGASRRPTAPTPSDPRSVPIVSDQPTAKPAPPIGPASEKIVGPSTGPTVHPGESAKPVPSDSPGQVVSKGTVATTKPAPPAQGPIDSTGRKTAVPASPIGSVPVMGRTESRSARQVSTARRVEPVGPAVRVASKEPIRPDPHTWSLVHPKAPDEKSADAH
jgi:hypothetical protein